MLEDDTPPIEVSHAENLDEQLLRKSVALDSVYEQAAFEIRLGRLDGKFTPRAHNLIECHSLVCSSHITQTFHQDNRTFAPRTCLGDVNTPDFPLSDTSRDFQAARHSNASSWRIHPSAHGIN